VCVGDEARDVVPGVLLEDGGEAVPEGGLARDAELQDLSDDVLDGDGYGPAVGDGDGDEAVVRVARRVRSIELGVEDGDGEAAGVEEAGEPVLSV
jgi:hypothetical protein